MADFDFSRHEEYAVDAAKLTRRQVESLARKPYPDPGVEPEAFADEAWRRQGIRDAWETRAAPERPESARARGVARASSMRAAARRPSSATHRYAIANARPGEAFEGKVRGKSQSRAWCENLGERREAALPRRASRRSPSLSPRPPLSTFGQAAPTRACLRYDWASADPLDAFEDAAEGDAGAEIRDYATSDGHKCFCVYVDLAGVDRVPASALRVELDASGRRATFTADLPAGRRVFRAPPALLQREVRAARVVRKGGDRVLLKFVKAQPRPWGAVFEGYGDVYPQDRRLAA